MTAKRVRRAGRTGLGVISIGLPILMFVGLSIFAPEFLSRQNIVNVNNQITALLIIALGQLLVALVGGIDISVGSVVSVTSTLIVTVDPAYAVPAALAFGVVVGLVNGFGVAYFGVHPLIMTLSTMTFLQGFALLLLAGSGGAVPDPIILLVKTSVFGMPAAFFWCVAAIAVFSLILYGSRFGLRVFAVGGNAHSAELSGVRALGPRIACYVLCATAGVVGGVYLTGRVASGDPTLGAPFSLDSVTAIALGGVQLSGGVGSVIGAALGAVTMGLITNGMNLLGVSPFLRTALTGVLLLGAVSLQRRKVIGI
jgi:ribose transport system permease protein